jgi:hypothetical protein
MSPSNEATLDQLLAEPIVQQLMRRDRIDETTIRHLLQETASARPASSAEKGLLDVLPCCFAEFYGVRRA